MIAAERWAQIDAAYYQIKLLRQTPARFAGLVYAWVLERTPHDKIDQLESDLDDLLPWEDSTSEAAAEIEGASFMAMAALPQDH